LNCGYCFGGLEGGKGGGLRLVLLSSLILLHDPFDEEADAAFAFGEFADFRAWGEGA